MKSDILTATLDNKNQWNNAFNFSGKGAKDLEFYFQPNHQSSIREK